MIGRRSPRFATLFLLCCATSVTVAADPESAAAIQPISQTHFVDTLRPALVENCGACHDPNDAENVVGFLFDQTPEDVSLHRDLWASVAEQLRNRTMPPPDETQPSEQQRIAWADWIESHLRATACSLGPFAGAAVPRRLNRDQYTNAIEDLTGIRFDFVEKIPADSGGGEGFDNNGEMLFLPPLLLERYLELADEILDTAIVVEPVHIVYLAFALETDGDRMQLTESSDRGDTIPPGQSASTVLRIDVESEFRCEVKAEFDGEDKPQHRLIISLDDVEVSDQKSTTLHLGQGLHRITLTNPESNPAVTLRRLELRANPTTDFDPTLRTKATSRILHPGRSQMADDPLAAATAIIRHFGATATRRPESDFDVDRLLNLFQRGLDRGEPFAQAIKLPLKAILVSPAFLFVSESDVAAADDATFRPLTDLELASRLSLFLWHSIPDRELIDVASDGLLTDPAELDSQLDRMLNDPRIERMAEVFAGGWLGTEAVGNTKIPDTNFFKPAYTSELINDLRDQVTSTMMYHLKHNRPITDWIDADYCIANRRLAKHYDIGPLPKSDAEFVAIELGDHVRTGALGLGAVHMLTSYSRRTSPVLRGGWVLETMFGTRLPAPPPEAGQLPGGEKESDKKTVRERLARHRDDPSCASCHQAMDPIGFAMENFDVLGRWRDKEGKFLIDSSGQFPDGESFADVIELRKILLRRKDQFAEEFCRRLLGYALGRSLQDADGCTVSQLTTVLADNEYRIRPLLHAMVHSVAFQNRQTVALEN